MFVMCVVFINLNYFIICLYIVYLCWIIWYDIVDDVRFVGSVDEKCD